jgi:hypothetical protein
MSLSIDAMKFALLILPVFAVLSFAQESTVTPPVQLRSISTEATQGEVRINIDTSAAVESSGSVVIFDDSLIWDLPGVAYERSDKHLVVNRSGVRDIFVSLQRRTPPLTRITVRLSRIHPYAVSTDGNRITLRITVAAQPSSMAAKAQRSQEQDGPVPAGRVGAAGALGGIFRRAPKPPVFEPPRQIPDSSAQNGPSSPPLPPIRFPETRPPGQNAPSTGAPETSSSGADGTAISQVPTPTKNEPAAESLNRSTAEDYRDGTAAAFVAPTREAVLGEQPLPLTATAPREMISAGAGLAPIPRITKPAGAELPSAGVPTSAAERTAPAVPNADLQTLFHVKFVQQDTAYIDGGRHAGLAEGMKLLVIERDPNGTLATNTTATAALAELTVVGIAETSAVTEIHTLQRDVVSGDVAYLSGSDLQTLVQQHSLSATRKYPAVISFTEDDDALDEEAREMDVPRPPLPSVNRMQGRIGFDYFGTHSLDDSRANGRDLGIVLRADFTRIGGTYWNFLGYWHGTIDSTSAASQATLQETINRTYHLGLTFDNPTGHWVAGFGRLYLPWASSLDTIDGGYFGRRFRPGVIVGIFAGSTPDPTSWNYNPQRQLGGSFVNFTGGSFSGFHYSSTSGAGLSLLSWKVDRPYIFFENSLSYRRGLSIYESLQADSPAGNAAVTAPGPGIGRSFFTVRWSPVSRLQLDFNHTYFRDIPTFDPTLIGTGLLDKYLFQGFSGGARVETVRQISLYAELGRSNRTGDTTMALNDMYGITFGRVPWLELRADAHYSRFNSSFGSGSYRAASLSRDLNDRLRLEILAGDQAFVSTLAGNQTARFVTATVENNISAYLFTQGGFTVYRGQQQNYNQWMLVLGYRFDSKWKRK